MQIPVRRSKVQKGQLKHGGLDVVGVEDFSERNKVLTRVRPNRALPATPKYTKCQITARETCQNIQNYAYHFL